MLRRVLSIAFGLSLAFASQVAFSQVGALKAPAEVVIRDGVRITEQAVAKQEISKILEETAKNNMVVPQNLRKDLCELLAFTGIIEAKDRITFIDSLNAEDGVLDSDFVKTIRSKLNSIASVNDRSPERFVASFSKPAVLSTTVAGTETVSSDTAAVSTLTSIEDVVYKYSSQDTFDKYGRTITEEDVKALTPTGEQNVVDVMVAAENVAVLGPKASVQASEQAISGVINFTTLHPDLMNGMNHEGLMFTIDTINAVESIYGVVSTITTTDNLEKYSTLTPSALEESGVAGCIKEGKINPTTSTMPL